jgi:hypothetical protein
MRSKLSKLIQQLGLPHFKHRTNSGKGPVVKVCKDCGSGVLSLRLGVLPEQVAL